MSYDGWIVLPIPGQDEDHTLAEIGNYTSNVSPMWVWCLSYVLETPTRLSDTEGWTCERAAPVLEKAVAVMEAERPRLEEMNPPNGWGNYGGALKYLRNVAELARRFSGLPGAYLQLVGVMTYRLEQLAWACALSLAGLGVAASIVLGGLIWRPSGRQS